MGTAEFQKELISYLEDENNKLRNKVTHMKENLEKVLTRDSSKNILDSIIEEVMNVCCAMTEEIEDLYEHFSATSAAVCTVLKRKSQMVQLTKKLSELHAVEQIDPELELIEASNMASFAKRLSDGKNKKGTAKVSPMIKGHVILTTPRIHLNRVNQEVRQRIVSESPQLSPVVEMSPASPPRTQRHFFREIQIPLQRLNINSEGQVINRNTEEAPRTSVIKKPTKLPASSLALRNSQPAQRHSETVVATPPIEEEQEETTREEEKENLSRLSEGEEENDSAVVEENSQIREDENNESQRSPSSLTGSPEANNEKNKFTSSPAESIDPLEGPSWLLDGQPDRRRSSTGSYSFGFVNVRRKRKPVFPANDSDPLALENGKSESKLDTTIEEEPEETEISEKAAKDKKNNFAVNDHLETSDMSMTECIPRRVVNIQTNRSSAGNSEETVESVSTHEIDDDHVNKSLAESDRPPSDIFDSTAGGNLSTLRVSEQPSLEVAENQCIVESSDDDEDEEETDNVSSLITPKAEKSKSKDSSMDSETLEETDDVRNASDLPQAELILEKVDVRSPVPSINSSKHLSPKNSKSDSLKAWGSRPKTGSESDASSVRSPDQRRAQSNNVTLTPDNGGRPKRGAALRCMENKLWILNTPDEKKNKTQGKNSTKAKRKPDSESEGSPNEKKQKKDPVAVKKKRKESESDSDTETEADTDSESGSESENGDSTPFSTPYSTPPKKKNPEPAAKNAQISKTNNQNNRNTASRLADADAKNKKKGSAAPVPSRETSFNDTNRTADRTTGFNGSSILEEEGRRRRRAAPASLKEPSLNSKLRRNH